MQYSYIMTFTKIEVQVWSSVHNGYKAILYIFPPYIALIYAFAAQMALLGFIFSSLYLA